MRKEACIDRIAGESAPVLLVSASDKLHNARAILSDLRGHGELLWPRFNKEAAAAGVISHYRVDGRWPGVSVSVHHAPGAEWLALTRAVRGVCEGIMRDYIEAGEPEPLEAVDWLVNGAGAFEIGGPEGDNGVSGKKLVAQASGTAVPSAGEQHSERIRARWIRAASGWRGRW